MIALRYGGRLHETPRRPRRLLIAAVAAVATVAAQLALHRPASAATGEGGDLLPVLLGLVIIIAGARLGGVLAARFRQSPVLGELLAGVVIGNLALIGVPGLQGLRDLPGLDLLAQIGVLFLLFQVGLESDVGRMLQVGGSAMLVAVLGVVVPMFLGFYCSWWFFRDHQPLSHWFVGATLCATSVGITARVLADLKKTQSTEGRIILGAAVIDDVLGLIVLAVVAGIIDAADRGATFQGSTVLWIVLKSVLFLAVAIVVGRWLSRHTFHFANRFQGEGLLLSLALAFCFGLAYLAGMAGLAPIVGAFAAGLVVDEVHYEGLKARERNRGLEELIEPLAAFLVPIFFVLMGMRVELSAFAAPGILGFAAALTVAAVIGKQVCSLGVLQRGADRIAVGLGMIPRGEVGLIFAGIGASLTIGGERVIDPGVFSAVVMMVAVTTLMTPPLLVWRLDRRSGLVS